MEIDKVTGGEVAGWKNILGGRKGGQGYDMTRDRELCSN